MRVRNFGEKIILRGFRVMLFRMVPKPILSQSPLQRRFRVMLFRMVPKQRNKTSRQTQCFRVMLFRMVPKRYGARRGGI